MYPAVHLYMLHTHSTTTTTHPCRPALHTVNPTMGTLCMPDAIWLVTE
jgi:hypothetical protein